MLSGGGCMYLCNALGHSKIRYICCLNEQAVTIAALGYAQYKNDFGVALVTSGPGATNAITGVAAAWYESVPMIVLSGQVKTKDSAELFGVRAKGVQEIPIIDIVAPITKYSITIKDPYEIRYHLEKALFLAKDKRPGPVWLDIPLDVQSSEINENILKPFDLPAKTVPNLKMDAEEVIKLINSAERPVMLAGYGIRVANCIYEFIKLIEKLNIPVLTTWKGVDLLPDDCPLFMGRPGIAGQRAANFIQQNSDLLICMGARLDFPQTGFNQSLFAREAKKIIVDIDEAELKKFKFRVDKAIKSDIGSFICALNSVSSSLSSKKSWIAQCRNWNKYYGRVPEEHFNKEDYASLYILVDIISNISIKDDIIVPGSSGMGSDVSYQVMRIKNGQRMFNSPGLGSMGFGIPSTLGACVASGGKRTICVNGDGGFQMNIQELETIKSHNLPIKFFVINNKGYASIRNTQRNYFGGFFVGSSVESGISLPDVKKQGNAYGYNVFSITKNEEIEKTVKKVLESKGPAICEVLINPNDTLEFRASSFIKPDGTAVSVLMEDLYPFLPRKEFYCNMYIKPVNKTGINLCNILFDLDGTIIDSRSGIISSMKYALSENGFSAFSDKQILSVIGKPLAEMIKSLIPNISEHTFNKIFNAYRKQYAQKGVTDFILYKNISNVIKTLANEYNLYVVTTKSQAMAQKALSHVGLSKYFKDIRGPDGSPTGKKKSELISDLVQKYGLNPQKTLMVGDRKEDVEAAAYNGIKTVTVSYGYGEKEKFDKSQLTVNNVDELLNVLF